MSTWLHWDSVDAFLAMGGYGLHVWGAYGATAAALALEGWLAHRRARRARDAALTAALARAKNTVAAR